MIGSTSRADTWLQTVEYVVYRLKLKGMAASPPTAPAAVATNSSIALAISNGTLGVGLSGSGFLIFYYTGVVGALA